MSQPQQRWCHACSAVHDFDGGWYEIWIGTGGECVLQPVCDPATYHERFRGDIFACGQLSALILVERYLHSQTFDPPAPDESRPTPTAFTEPIAQLH